MTSALARSERALVVAALVLLPPLVAGSIAAESDWAEGSAGLDDGATRDDYNRGALLPWSNYLGDWRDAADVAPGDAAYATANVVDDDTDRFVAWDVTALVRAWTDGAARKQGFLLRRVGGGGTFNFRSKEHAQAAERPELVVTTASGPAVLGPVADTYLESSTYRAQGNIDRRRVDDVSRVLLRFDLSGFAPGSVTSATLRCSSTRRSTAAPASTSACSAAPTATTCRRRRRCSGSPRRTPATPASPTTRTSSCSPTSRRRPGRTTGPTPAASRTRSTATRRGASRRCWYCIEQYAQMNTPGVNDGILRAWVDGRLAFEKTDIRLRDVTTLKIEADCGQPSGSRGTRGFHALRAVQPPVIQSACPRLVPVAAAVATLLGARRPQRPAAVGTQGVRVLRLRVRPVRMQQPRLGRREIGAGQLPELPDRRHRPLLALDGAETGLGGGVELGEHRDVRAAAAALLGLRLASRRSHSHRFLSSTPASAGDRTVCRHRSARSQRCSGGAIVAPSWYWSRIRQLS